MEKKGSKTRVVLADDHEPTRFLLKTLLEFVPAVEVVAVAANGQEAAERALSLEADVVLLDVEMPVMDGFMAAELIAGHRPSTRIILHTAHADSRKFARAEALGLPLLVKLGFEETVAAVSERFERVSEVIPGPRAIEAIVLAGLAAQEGPAMVIVHSDGSVPFYTADAGEMLDLPAPSQPMTLADLRAAHPLLDRLGNPVSIDSDPLQRCLVEHTRQQGELSERLPNGALRTYRLNVLPLFDQSGEFLGAASFMTVLAETRPSAAHDREGSSMAEDAPPS